MNVAVQQHTPLMCQRKRPGITKFPPAKVTLRWTSKAFKSPARTYERDTERAERMEGGKLPSSQITASRWMCLVLSGRHRASARADWFPLWGSFGLGTSCLQLPEITNDIIRPSRGNHLTTLLSRRQKPQMQLILLQCDVGGTTLQALWKRRLCVCVRFLICIFTYCLSPDKNWAFWQIRTYGDILKMLYILL